MDIRPLSPLYAVSPQIDPADAEAIRSAGYAAVICNRPDGEVPDRLGADAVRRAVERQGMTFVENPVVSGALSMENVEQQAAAMDDSAGPILAYCASGNRSSILWALAEAGRMPTEEILQATAAAGYDHSGLRGQIDALAARRGGG